MLNNRLAELEKRYYGIFEELRKPFYQSNSRTVKQATKRLHEEAKQLATAIEIERDRTYEEAKIDGFIDFEGEEINIQERHD